MAPRRISHPVPAHSNTSASASTAPFPSSFSTLRSLPLPTASAEAGAAPSSSAGAVYTNGNAHASGSGSGIGSSGSSQAIGMGVGSVLTGVSSGGVGAGVSGATGGVISPPTTTTNANAKVARLAGIDFSQFTGLGLGGRAGGTNTVSTFAESLSKASALALSLSSSPIRNLPNHRTPNDGRASTSSPLRGDAPSSRPAPGPSPTPEAQAEGGPAPSPARTGKRSVPLDFPARKGTESGAKQPKTTKEHKGKGKQKEKGKETQGDEVVEGDEGTDFGEERQSLDRELASKPLLPKRRIVHPTVPELFVRRDLNEEEEVERSRRVEVAVQPQHSKDILATLSAHRNLYQKAYNALTDDLIKIQIEESILRNLKIAVNNTREKIKWDAEQREKGNFLGLDDVVADQQELEIVLVEPMKRKRGRPRKDKSVG